VHSHHNDHIYLEFHFELLGTECGCLLGSLPAPTAVITRPCPFGINISVIPPFIVW
jgi:hypothetical protein